MSTTLNDTPAAAGGTSGAAPISELVSGILSDGQRLLKQQVDMVRAEIREDFRKTKDVVVYLGVGVALAAVGGLCLLVALVHLVNYLTQWHMAACWGLVGGLAVVAGVVAFVLGGRIMGTYNPLPDKSLNALQENVSWIANPQT